MAVGLGLVMASGCVFNNYLDRDIDSIMSRTQGRALVRGLVNPGMALGYGLVQGLTGLVILTMGTNLLAAGLAFGGWILYVLVYGFWKRRSVHGTAVGSLAGAIPPVVGYCAATGRFDTGAFILFFILVLWQMPHFYAIAMFRFKDYKAANIPVLPVKQGMRAAKLQILVYIIAFIMATLALSLAGYTGYSFAIIMAAVGLAWFLRGWRGFTSGDDSRWGRNMFRSSLIVILALSVMLSVGAILP